VFEHRSAVPSEPADGEVLQVHRTVDGRAARVADQDQEFVLVRRGDGDRVRPAGPGEDAQPAARHRHPLPVGQGVVGAAEEHEVAGGQPVQQGDRLHGIGAAQWSQLRRRSARPGHHRLPVGDHDSQRVQSPVQTREQRLDERFRRLAERRVDLDGDPRLGQARRASGQRGEPAVAVPTHPQLGVVQPAKAPLLAGQFHGDGVDEERPVIGDEQQQGRAVRTGAGQLARRQCPQPVLAVGPGGTQVEVGAGSGRQGSGLDAGQVRLRHWRQIGGHQMRGVLTPAHCRGSR
jgi:hypothetical protein